MKNSETIDIFKERGNLKIRVLNKDLLENTFDYVENGMIGEITYSFFYEEEGIFEIEINWEKYYKENLIFEKKKIEIKRSLLEIVLNKEKEFILFSDTEDWFMDNESEKGIEINKEEEAFEIIDTKTVKSISLWKESNSELGYIDWLEMKVLNEV